LTIQSIVVPTASTMGFFRRKQQQQEEPEPEEPKEVFVIEVQDINHEELYRSPRSSSSSSSKQVIVNAPTAESDEEDEINPFRVEMDLKTHRKTPPPTPTNDLDENNEEKYVRNRRNLIRMLVCLTGVVLVAIILAVSLSLTRSSSTVANNDEAEPPVEEEEPVTWEPIPTTEEAAAYLMEILQISSPSQVAKAMDDSTPQGRAFSVLVVSEQLAESPTPPFSVIQRYALMVLYYSTSGGPSAWTNSFGWNAYGDDECQWNAVDTCRFTEEGYLAVTNLDLGEL
jgi:hypothetical protein